ncbi:MRG/MORF4L-binding protein-like [Xenia sp. Carnegie-2017]|uniref:MRG/MORF4L-binding protein-like n=1 Tax=Xenia sp. Carnegie-2017 TaxID=2897299 RepID=UPI001F037629|nr:MRG/MORF4L-binding protein-like [Xenia sp. Carnegie-2017]
MDAKEVLVWTPELEVTLFHSMKGHKPTGINRHFHMACIHDKFITATGKRNISSKQLWQHLQELYNLQALNETEGLPFPNEENEFNLPDEIFEPQASSDYNEEDTPGPSPGHKSKSLSGSGSRPTTPRPSTPDTSPKRKRTRGSNTSQPPSPHSSTGSTTTTKRRR